ncbi:MAG: hypothetical protein JO040_04760 [Gemmatimonadetes bacterium]|nr:hypothetical protein [Gemmatimonadota bacterium]
MPGAPHRIRRQRWTVRTGSAAGAFAVRGLLRGGWEEALLPAFERAFDRAAPGPGVIRIPRLEIRVSVASEEELMEVLPGLVYQEVCAQLRGLLGDDALDRPVRSGGPERVVAGGSAPGESVPGGVAAGEHGFAALLHYLRTGTLPWAEAGRPRDEVVPELEADCRAGVHRFADLWRGGGEAEAFWFRLLQLLGEDGALALVEALAAELSLVRARVLARLLAPSRDAGLPAGPRAAGGVAPALYARLRVAAALLAAPQGSAAAEAPEEVAAVVRTVLHADGAEIAPFLSLLGDILPVTALAPGRAGPGGSGALPSDESEPETAPGGTALRRPGRQGGGVARGSASDPSVSPEEPNGDEVPDPGRRTDEGEEDDFPLLVASAGLVLLHPFLPALFENTGLLEAGGLPERSLPRAAALLHHAATGRRDVLELELGMVKTLLGLAPDTPLPVAEGVLRDSDVEEVEGLLQAVIGHWSVLKSTSVEGLRGSFLSRPGLLHRDENGWVLRVEPAAFDVLLDHLPWGIGIVRLPWMTQTIYTEWTTH